MNPVNRLVMRNLKNQLENEIIHGEAIKVTLEAELTTNDEIGLNHCTDQGPCRGFCIENNTIER